MPVVFQPASGALLTAQLLATLALLPAAPCTAACDEITLSGHAQPVVLITHLAQQEGMPPGGGRSTAAVSTVTENGKVYELRVVNGAVSASVDGKPLPPERIRHDGNRVVLLDEQGREIRSLQISIPGEGAVVAMAGRNGQGGRAGGGAIAAAGQPGMPGSAAGGGTGGSGGSVPTVRSALQPRVMLGIVMAPVEPALRHHLGLAEGQGVLLNEVWPDLAAAKAGLQQYDVLVTVDGRPASDAMIRELILTKEPGQTIRFEVRRADGLMTIDVPLAAYDAEAMPQAATNDAFALLESLMADDHFDRGQLEAMLEAMRSRGAMRFSTGPDAMFFRSMPQGVPLPPAAPAGPGAGHPGAAPDGPTAERLDRLEERIDELGARIDRLLRQIERSAG